MKTIVLLAFVFSLSTANAQLDTSFWFAAPDISQAFSYDRPTRFIITAGNQSSTVTLSFPANGSVIPIVRNLAPNSTTSIDFITAAEISNIECAPGNQVLNKGVLIRASTPVSVYYEVNVLGPNPEIFSLKGRNALGTEFLISSQYILSNSSDYFPLALSSFNIVATENNTQVTITPSKNIVGRPANIPFTISLNRGQTYAAIASSQLASEHLHGSTVISSKPVAVTLSDDLLWGGAFTGVCADLAGDQTVPTTVIGSEYIAFKSELNAPFDKVYVTAVQNGTTVSQDGIPIVTLNRGQSRELTVSSPISYITSSLPMYAYHLAGTGCEVGSAVLPKINCTGSSKVSITRSTDEPFRLYILVKNGGQNSFLFNGSSTVIPGSAFSVVPGTGGQWVYAKITVPLSTLPNGAVARIENSSALFQLGVLQGSIRGASYGYFSDFNTIVSNATATPPSICEGSQISLFAETVTTATYAWNGPSGFTSNLQNPTIPNATVAQTGDYILTVTLPGCGIYRDTVKVNVLPKRTSSISQSICQGQSFLGFSTTGIHTYTTVGSNGCDSIVTINLTVKPRATSTINQTICQGESFEGYFASGIYTNTFVAANGCDSIRTLNLTVKPRSQSFLTQTICEGQSFLGYSTTGVFQDTLVAANGCDSIRRLTLTVNPRLITSIAQNICEGQSFLGYSSSGIYRDTFQTALGCDSIRVLTLTVAARTFSNLNISICQGQTFNGYSSAGIYRDTLINSNGCDSIRVINLTVKSRSTTTINQTICQGESFEGYSSSGIYTNTFVAANGCDSIRTLNLTVKPRAISNFSQTICAGQSFFGYTTSGVFQDTLVAANGCDSIRRLTLTVSPLPITSITQRICEGQSFLGYNSTGIYRDTFRTALGCDSVRVVNLTVSARTFSTLNISICPGQSFNGYSSPGIYRDTLVNSNGCDSIRTINLSLRPPSFATISTQICEGDSISGYSAAGTYIDTLINSSGCDSIRTLILTVKPRRFSSISQTICVGSSFEGYNQSGVYLDTLLAANGCDSVRTLTLTVIPRRIPDLGPDRTICPNDTIRLSPGVFSQYLWQDGSTGPSFLANSAGVYSVRVQTDCGFETDEMIISNRPCEAYFPNVFSPNNDGKNDGFRVLNVINPTNFILRIYDRWGNLVFQSSDYLKAWDGRRKGVPADVGNYVWHCIFSINQRKYNMKGNVLLIR